MAQGGLFCSQRHFVEEFKNKVQKNNLLMKIQLRAGVTSKSLLARDCFLSLKLSQEAENVVWVHCLKIPRSLKYMKVSISWWRRRRRLLSKGYVAMWRHLAAAYSGWADVQQLPRPQIVMTLINAHPCVRTAWWVEDKCSNMSWGHVTLYYRDVYTHQLYCTD